MTDFHAANCGKMKELFFIQMYNFTMFQCHQLRSTLLSSSVFRRFYITRCHCINNYLVHYADFVHILICVAPEDGR